MSEWSPEASKRSLEASEQPHGGKELLEVTWWLLDDNWGGTIGNLSCHMVAVGGHCRTVGGFFEPSGSLFKFR